MTLILLFFWSQVIFYLFLTFFIITFQYIYIYILVVCDISKQFELCNFVSKRLFILKKQFFLYDLVYFYWEHVAFNKNFYFTFINFGALFTTPKNFILFINSLKKFILYILNYLEISYWLIIFLRLSLIWV